MSWIYSRYNHYVIGLHEQIICSKFSYDREDMSYSWVFFFVVLGGGKTVPLLYTSMFKEGTGLIVPPTTTIGTNIYLYIIMYFFKAIQWGPGKYSMPTIFHTHIGLQLQFYIYIYRGTLYHIRNSTLIFCNTGP